MTATVLHPFSKRKIFFLALSFYAVFGFSNVSYFLPVYYEQIGAASPGEIGWMVSIFYIVSVASRLFLGGAVAALGFRKMFLAAGVLAVASSVAIAAVGANFWPAFLARAVLGLASSMFQIALGTYQAVAFTPHERGQAFSLIMAGGLAPMMTIVPFGDWLLLRGFSGVYILLPLALCVMAALVTPAIPGLAEAHVGASPDRARGQSANPFRGLGECLTIPAFRLAVLSIFLFGVTDAASSFMSPMTASFGLMASFFLSSNAVVGVCVRLFLGHVLDRFPRWLMAAPATLITAGTLYLASVGPTDVSLIVLGLIFGVGMGFGFPLHLALVSDSVPMRLQPQAVSISWFIMGFDFAAVPLLTGLMSDLFGPVAAFRIVSGLTLLGTCATAVLWRRLHRRQQGRIA